MSRVDRHYRLSRAAYERILERDTNMFPTEKDFVAAAVLSYDDKSHMQDMENKLDEMNRKLDQIMKAMGW